MADTEFRSKVSPEGRVVIPASVRRALGVGPGDAVSFLVSEGSVRLVSARTLVDLMWANNVGVDDLDAGRAVREMRDRDREAEARRAEADHELWDEQEQTARLLSELGFTP